MIWQDRRERGLGPSTAPGQARLAQDDRFKESLTRPATEPVAATTEKRPRRPAVDGYHGN